MVVDEKKTPIIKADRVGKIFKLYNRRFDRLKDTFLPFKRDSSHRPFHALQDISFVINRGETVGIVGRNGSGKSTLLQVICGIMKPSHGTVETDGRISALLELGAGFNPEYTGRENVYFNASVMGIGKEEVDDRFDQIEQFADIGPFIDQPVKTYSSGMYVRLAFSVAIHVDPDILIVDEALAVGDAIFQAKCFAKFREFQQKKVTILFVTHSTDLITRYCQRALLLESGRLEASGTAKEVVDHYNRMIVGSPGAQGENETGGDNTMPEKTLSDKNKAVGSGAVGVAFMLNKAENRYGDGKAEIIDVGISSLNDISLHSVFHGEAYRFWMKVYFHASIKDPIYAYTIKDVKGFDITGTNTYYQKIDTGTACEGQMVLVTFDQRMMLNSGSYVMSFGCAGFENGAYVVYDRRYDLIFFEVVSSKESVGIFDLGSQICFEPIEPNQDCGQ